MRKKEEHETETLCPVVTTEQMPSAVLDSFAVKYPTAIVTTWFNKDNTGYCAAFTLDSIPTKALFRNNGTFVKQESEINNDNQTGNHQDNNSGCECELQDSEQEGDWKTISEWKPITNRFQTESLITFATCSFNHF